jgi:hypothetical protein
MEWWIAAGLVLAVVATGLVSRVCKSRQRPVERDGKTIYPLW